MMTKEHFEAKKNNVRIFIVDDHPIVREGLAQLINQHRNLMVCGQSEDAEKSLEAIATLKYDMIIVDLTLKRVDGIELIKNIKAHDARLPVLVLSIRDEALYAERALLAGARGYVMKLEATEKVMLAIRRVLSGEIYVSEKMSSRMLYMYITGRCIICFTSPVLSWAMTQFYRSSRVKLFMQRSVMAHWTRMAHP
jgi:DNA-binding NarL/FixJ family response regulator